MIIGSRGLDGRYMKRGEARRRELSRQNLKRVRQAQIQTECSGNHVNNPVSVITGTDNGTFTNNTRCYPNLPIIGRRIMDPLFIIKQLRAGCEECGCELSFARLTSETRRGLASLYYISCECGMLNTVYSSSFHCEQEKKKPIFDINTKAATGIYI